MLAHLAQEQGIEGFNAVEPLVFPQERGHLCAKRGVHALSLQLHEDRHAAVDQGEHLAEGGNGLLRSAKRKRAKLGGAKVTELAFASDHAVEGVVVEDHHLAVARELNVKLNAKALLAGQVKGGTGVLGDPASVQSTVRVFAE